jgi:hypothetical protein
MAHSTRREELALQEPTIPPIDDEKLNELPEAQDPELDEKSPSKPIGKTRGILISTLIVLTQLVQVSCI